MPTQLITKRNPCMMLTHADLRIRETIARFTHDQRAPPAARMPPWLLGGHNDHVA